MLRRRSCIWPVVAVALWSGCALGPLGSHRRVSPVELPVDYEQLGRLPAARGVAISAPQAPRSLAGEEIETLWGKLSAENPELADLSAGEEITIRHIYGEKEYGETTRSGKVLGLVLLGLLCWGMAEIMSTE